MHQLGNAGATLHVDADVVAYVYCGDDETTLDAAKANLADTMAATATALRVDMVLMHLTSAGSNKGSRYEMAFTQPYQGQRRDVRKPRLYAPLRAWLMSEPAICENTQYSIATHAEADDTIGCGAVADLKAGRTPYILTKDKDLRMIPGVHVNWDTGARVVLAPDVFSLVHGDKTYGTAFFWGQMLSGDMVDNIRGIPGIGQNKAAGILKHVGMDSTAFSTVLEQYRQKFGEAATSLFCESAALLWIRRCEASNRFDFLRWLRGVDGICPEEFNDVLGEYARLYGKLKTFNS
jgi:DNA polymerase-1